MSFIYGCHTLNTLSIGIYSCRYSSISLHFTKCYDLRLDLGCNLDKELSREVGMSGKALPGSPCKKRVHSS